MNVDISAAVANAITEGMFKTNLMEFFTGRVNNQYKPGADGSSVLTRPELLGAGPGGIGGNYGTSAGYDSLGAVLTSNLKKNGFKMATAVIVIPMVAQVAKKLLRKPVILPANRLLKSTGLDVKLG